MVRTRLARVAGVSVAALACGLALTPAPAVARPVRAAGLVASSDASLSGLAVAGSSVTSLGPQFLPENHDYDVVSRDDASVEIHPTPADGAATAAVRVGSTNYPLSAGAATVPLVRGRNDLVVTVTAEDTVTTESYRLTVWRAVAPSAQILSLTNTEPTLLGGTRSTVTMTHGFAPPPECYATYRVGSQSGQRVGDPTFDARTGTTKVVLQLPESQEQATGPADLAVEMQCGNGWDLHSVTTAKNAYTYTDNFQITSAEVPDPLTATSVITLHGPGVVTTSAAVFWLTDDAGHTSRLARWGWTGEDNAQVYPDYHPSGDQEIYDTPGPRTLYAGSCPNQEDLASCTVLWSKAVTWKVPAPTDLSFTPVSGPTGGGTELRLKGRFLVSGAHDLKIMIGEHEVSGYSTDEYGDEPDDYTYPNYVDGHDILEIEAPATLNPGPVRITVSTNYGTATARGTFTYAAKPAVTAVAPDAVANSGGSVITLTGTDFGTSGRPTVIVNGVKSPFVTRLSATQVTAVVPPFPSSTGAVEVQVSSPQGGGISDPAALTLTAPGSAPTVSTVTPATAKVGDAVTITGSGFGAAGTVGVSVGGAWARVTASTATSISFEVPAVDSGVKDLLVGTTTGSRTRTGGLTVTPVAGITTVSPASVPSYATGADATVVLTGAGFGSSGTVKVGSAAARAYTAGNGGTRIAGVVVPTTSAASLPIVVDPAGAAPALKAAVRVTGPVIGYAGAQPRVDTFGNPDADNFESGVTYDVPTTGGTTVRVEGSGFGDDGVVKVAGTVATVISWSGTVITFTAPARPAGLAALTVTPQHSPVTATRSRALNYVAGVGMPSIASIASVADLGHTNRNEFHSEDDLTDAFTLTGAGLTGSSAPATRVTVSDFGGENPVVEVPTALTATSLQFTAPRSFTSGGWKRVSVSTNVGAAALSNGILYLNVGPEKGISPSYGLCLRTQQTVSGGGTVYPAMITITNTGTLFGSLGAVTIGGQAITPVAYSESQVVLDLTELPVELTNPWGSQQIVITPSDTSKPAQTMDFLCALVPSVATTANSSTDHLTVDAGTSYTLGYQHTGFLGASPFTATAPDGYDYVTAVDFGNTGFTSNVHVGAPAAAGDYYVRVARSRASYDTERYRWLEEPAPVRVTITGTPITVTAVSDNGATFTYQGQLGDGTVGSPADFHYTATSVPDPVTKVFWQFRNSACDTQADTAYWRDGLPGDVAVSDQDCGGDGTTRVSWDVRVKSIEMKTTGTDRSVFYELIHPTTRITITPRNVTIAEVRADRRYDGTSTAVLGELTVEGALEGDSVALLASAVHGEFADPAPGVDKPVTLSADLELGGAARGNYLLTNPRPTILGTITKADAVLGLSAAPGSVLLSLSTPITVTATVLDRHTGAPPLNGAGLAAVVLVSATPNICTISGTTVTAIAAGDCVIEGSQAASTNYNAATAASDETSTVETVGIKVFAAPRTITVVADDLTVAVGDPVEPTAQVTGLFDGDTVGSVEFDFYDGETLLVGTPTAPGSYRIVPKAGILSAATQLAYTNPTAFGYVAGTLLITALPPVLTRVQPDHGYVSGNTPIVVTGLRLDSVRTVQIGLVTLRVPDFSVNPEGTELSFRSPAVAAPGDVLIVLSDGVSDSRADYTYLADPVHEPDLPEPPAAEWRPVRQLPNGRLPAAPLSLRLALHLNVDSRLSGAQAGLSGGDLKPRSAYTLQMYSQPVTVTSGVTDADGNFRQILTMPGRACVRGGLHRLVLTGIAPNGYPVQATQWIVLDDTCIVRAISATAPARATLRLRSFLFAYKSANLTASDKSILAQLASGMRGAKVVTIVGYTQTQKTSPASIRANRILAMQRATNVRDYLRTRGVRARFVLVGRGPVDPVSRRDQKLNRRVTIDATY